MTQFNDPRKILNIKNCLYKEKLREVMAPVASIGACTLGLPSFLYCYYRKPGDLDACVAFAEIHFDDESLSGFAYGYDKLLHAEKYLERGELEKARNYAMQAIHKAWLREQMFIVACAHYVLGRVALFEGDSKEVETQLDIIKFEIPRRLSFVPPPETARIYAMMAELCEIIMYCTMQHTKQIASRIPDMHSFGKKYLYRGMGIPELIKIKFKILSGEFVEADVLCDFYEKECARYPAQMGFLRHKILRSVVSAHLYDISTAKNALRTALEEAALDDIITPFVENAEYVLPLLEAIKPTPRVSKEFLDKVRKACVHFSTNRKKICAPDGAGTLSRRENEVFHLLAKGMSQKNIAVELDISPFTVKIHLKNIYAKLGVDNRVAALGKVFALGI